MAYLMTITYDLDNSDTSVYPKIYKDLEELDFSKVIKGQKKIETKLPSNTFVAKFDVDEFEDKKDAREWLKEEIKEIFNSHGVSGKFFIAVSKGWAWSVGTV